MSAPENLVQAGTARAEVKLCTGAMCAIPAHCPEQDGSPTPWPLEPTWCFTYCAIKERKGQRPLPLWLGSLPSPAWPHCFSWAPGISLPHCRLTLPPSPLSLPRQWQGFLFQVLLLCCLLEAIMSLVIELSDTLSAHYSLLIIFYAVVVLFMKWHLRIYISEYLDSLSRMMCFHKRLELLKDRILLCIPDSPGIQ